MDRRTARGYGLATQVVPFAERAKLPLVLLLSSGVMNEDKHTHAHRVTATADDGLVVASQPRLTRVFAPEMPPLDS